VTGLNFGADAFTENTIRLQMKGYTLDTLIQNHEDCVRAGIVPNINIVIGVPGETDDDLEEAVRFLASNKRLFPVINNINYIQLVQNSVYWWEPEKHNIFFCGDKDEIYKRYYFGVPCSMWYSTEPFIDRGVRVLRMERMIKGLQAAGATLGGEVLANFQDAISGAGHMVYRELSVHTQAVGALKQSALRLPEGTSRTRQIRSVYDNRLVVPDGPGRSLVFEHNPQMAEALHHLGRPYWWQGTLHQ
jgi:hypothetical protein